MVRFRGANWRLYNPDTHQWSTNYANASVGVISTPGIGEFKNEMGEFTIKRSWAADTGS